MPLAVNGQSDAVAALQDGLSLTDDLLGGTDAMRKAGTKRLPKWPNEEAASYNDRLATATLFPAYKRTVRVMAGKPFSKELQLSDDTPASISNWSQDIDQQGVSLNVFAAEMFERIVGSGIAGVLVDYPAVPSKGKTVAAVEQSGARPYFVRVTADQILGWKSAVVAGKTKLTQLRLLESVEEDDGPYGIKLIPQVRVLVPGGWELWQAAGDKGAWIEVASGRTTLADIPYVPFYGERQAFMIGTPPMIDLAHLNVKHWQSQSDQDTIMHVARVPILAMIGASIDETQLVVGASSAVKLPENADLKYVEHSGAAIAAGAASLEALEEQMVQTGAELLVQKPGQRTATESSNDAEANKSDLQRIAEQFEDSLDQALWFMAQYAHLPTGGTVSLFKDYGAGSLSDASASLVKDLNALGIVTKGTVINEMKRRGVLASDINTDKELAEAEAEGPAVGTLVDPQIAAADSVKG